MYRSRYQNNFLTTARQNFLTRHLAYGLIEVYCSIGYIKALMSYSFLFYEFFPFMINSFMRKVAII